MTIVALLLPSARCYRSLAASLVNLILIMYCLAGWRDCIAHRVGSCHRIGVHRIVPELSRIVADCVASNGAGLVASNSMIE